MRRILLLIALVVAVCVSAHAQVTPPKPIKSVGTLPTTCYYALVGRVDEIYKTGASAGFYTCNSSGTSWDGPYASSGGVASITGTANQIVVTGTTTPTLSIPSTLVAPGTITATTSTASPFFVSTNADPADAGAIRLGNAELIEWESSPASTDVTLTVNSSEQFVFSAPVSALTIGAGSSITSSGAGGALGTNAFTSTAYAPIASPTFTGTVVIPTLFILGAVSVTSTGTQLNYLASATGTTGAASTNLVFSTSPALTTPSLGVATATSINGNTFTTGTYTLTGVAGKTLTFNKSLTLEGTDSTTMTFPTTSATIARTDVAQTFTGINIFSSNISASSNVNLTSSTAGVGFNNVASTTQGLSSSGVDMLLRLGTSGLFYIQSVSGGAQLAAFNSNGTIILNTTTYNTCTALTTTAAVLGCTVSDERVKNNKKQFSVDALSIIRKVEPITFSFKEGTAWYKGGRTELGLSAQNLKAANPLLASSTGNELDLLQPEPMALHAIEIGAIKALDAKVDANLALGTKERSVLESKIDAMQKEIDTLRARP